MRVKFIDVDGVQTRYFYEGSGYPLLLLHGGNLNADAWFQNIDPLGKDFFVVAPDMVGHGYSKPVEDQPGSPYPYRIKHLKGLLDTLGIDKFAVAGSSMGGLIATLFYFAMPQRVEKLIIIGSGSTFNEEEDQTRVRKESYANAKSAIGNPTLETCRKRLQNIFYHKERVPETILLAQVTAYSLPWFPEAWEQRARGAMDLNEDRKHRVYDRLEQINVPMLVISGREDPRTIHERVVEGVKKVPNARLETFEGCGHLPYMEHPEKFNEVVRDFVKAGVTSAPLHS